MSIIMFDVPSSTPLKKSSPTDGLDGSRDYVGMADTSRLRSNYPMGTVLDAFVTNVHNVPQLRFFMFVKSAENAQHFANVRYASTPPNAYKCLRMPREGYVFALRLGESTMLRAVRLRTMCITTTREVFLPDVGRSHLLVDNELDMYHLPLKLRKPPGLAVPCLLRGVNDDVTILPDNMRAFLRGLLFRSVKLRVDGYTGNTLKVQLLDVSLEELDKWTAELGEEEHDFGYALKRTVLYKPKNKLNFSRSDSYFGKNETLLSPIAELVSSSSSSSSSSEEDEESNNDENRHLPGVVITPSTPSALPSPVSSDSWFSALDVSVVPPMLCPLPMSSVASPFTSENHFLSHISVSSLAGRNIRECDDETVPIKHEDMLSDIKDTSKDLTTESLKTFTVNSFGFRPILGRYGTEARPILGGVAVQIPDKSWKRDVLPALTLIDNRQFTMNFSREELLTITPTYIGQLERFFGIVHRRDECYMQHMWTDEEIPWSSRFMGTHTPYVFDIVLAKHSGDFKWYRAKVIEISKDQRKVLVFYVDYGGIEYVDVWNLANLCRSISELPFQAVLFRLYDLIDVTSSKAERELGVDFLRNALLKKTLTVRVLNYKNNEITICFEDQRFSHIPATLIRKGLMKHFSVI